MAGEALKAKMREHSDRAEKRRVGENAKRNRAVRETWVGDSGHTAEELRVIHWQLREDFYGRHEYLRPAA